MSSKVQKAPFLCPVCLELPEGKIFQCRNGHSVCAGCSKELQHCPQCRVPFQGDRIRNLAMEELIGEMEIPCTHKEAGCTVEISRKELSAHLASCRFRPIGICKLLGHDRCDFVSCAPNELFKHVVSQHNKNKLGSKTTYCLTINELLKLIRISKKTKVCSIGVEITSKCGILIIYTWNKEKDDFSIFCIHFAEEEEGCPHVVTIKLMDSTKNTCLSWTRKPVYYNKLEESLKELPMKIPLRFLSEQFDQPGAYMHFEFTPKDANSE